MLSVIASEVAYLRDSDLGFVEEADVVVALRTITNQLFQCYVSSGEVHTMHMMRHLGGYIQYYFDEHRFAQNVRPMPEKQTFGEWLIHLNRLVTTCEESVIRGAVGDLRGHFMTILSLVCGAMQQHGAAMRQGYETY